MSSTSNAPTGNNRVRIVVATSVMLTFISYWRAAAIILNDLGSSAFYAGGIAEQAIGKSAPWFILGVMLFAFAVRAVYVESCSMFVRGGVYRVVKEALGGTLAKFSVSALMFDYILTGPVSGVSAGQYIAGLINDTIAIADAHGWLPAAFIIFSTARRRSASTARLLSSQSPSRSIFGGRTSRALRNPAKKRSGSCRSRPSWSYCCWDGLPSPC